MRDRFRGCLVGQCIGDALGCPVEGNPPALCADYVASDMFGRLGRAPFPFGQYTDDSQLARELASSIVERGRFVPEDYAARIAAIFREERIVGRGTATENAARRLERGVPWDQAGEPAPSAGNGSAMRAAPVGLACFADRASLVRVAVDQGRITHQDPRCGAGCAAIAAAVAIALDGTGPIDVAAFAREVAATAAPVSPAVADTIAQLAAWVALPPEQAVQHIARPSGARGSSASGSSQAAHDAAEFSDRWQGISPFVTASVTWSLYAFLRSPDDFLATMRTAIAVGGDVDTTAAMAGAISGARLGLAALPAELAAAVHDQGTWQLAELVALADRLHDLVVPG